MRRAPRTWFNVMDADLSPVAAFRSYRQTRRERLQAPSPLRGKYRLNVESQPRQRESNRAAGDRDRIDKRLVSERFQTWRELKHRDREIRAINIWESAEQLSKVTKKREKRFPSLFTFQRASFSLWGFLLLFVTVKRKSRQRAARGSSEPCSNLVASESKAR